VIIPAPPVVKVATLDDIKNEVNKGVVSGYVYSVPFNIQDNSQLSADYPNYIDSSDKIVDGNYIFFLLTDRYKSIYSLLVYTINSEKDNGGAITVVNAKCDPGVDLKIYSANEGLCVSKKSNPLQFTIYGPTKKGMGSLTMVSPSGTGTVYLDVVVTFPDKILADKKSIVLHKGITFNVVPQISRQSLASSTEVSINYNNERNSHVNTILNVITQYSVDNNGAIPSAITTVPTELCTTTGNTCFGMVDLGSIVTSKKYILSVPVDPKKTTGSGSGYFISKNANGRITVSAPLAEQGATISVTR
jgi:hypothetical protein